MKKRVAAVLAAVLLIALAPLPAEASPAVYFTAVNETLLELKDETMPFWAGGDLYVPSAAFEERKTTLDSEGSIKTELGIFFSHNAAKKRAMLLRGREGLVFDLEAGTIEDNSTHEYLPGAAIVRGGRVFFPLDLVAKFFGLSWSNTKVSYGRLIRIKNENASLSDRMFVEAAESPMSYRYNRYEKSRSSEQPVLPEQGEQIAEKSSTACLCVRFTSVSDANRILNTVAMANQRIAFLWDGTAGADELLRHIIGTGNTVILAADASGGTEETLRSIKKMNEKLWSAANVQTRFVWLRDGEKKTRDAVAEKGYCPIDFAADLSGTNNAARLAEKTIAAAQKGSRVPVLLGEDTKVASRIMQMMPILQEGKCSAVRLRER